MTATNIRIDYEGSAPHRAGDVYADGWDAPLGRITYLPESNGWKMWVNLPRHLTGGYGINTSPGQPDLIDDPDDAASIVAWQSATDDVPAKRGAELEVGDVIRAIGEEHTITDMRPYGPSNIDFIDERWRTALSGSWGMTIDPDRRWRQLPDGVWVGSHHYCHEIDERFGGLLGLLRHRATQSDPADPAQPAQPDTDRLTKENAR